MSRKKKKLTNCEKYLFINIGKLMIKYDATLVYNIFNEIASSYVNDNDLMTMEKAKQIIFDLKARLK